MVDYSIWEDNAYQFVIINKNKKASPNDEKLKNTLFAIVENFFSERKISYYIFAKQETENKKREANYSYDGLETIKTPQNTICKTQK